MRQQLTDRWYALTAARRALVVAGAAGLLLIVLFFMVPTWFHRAGDYLFRRSADKQRAQLEQQIKEAERAKTVAVEALRQLEEAKQQLATEKQKREAAEQLLADRTKTTDAKLKALDEVRRMPTPTPLPRDATVDDLCAAAARLGISCDR